VSKQAMVESAKRTLAFFNLKPNQSALLCLPVSFIAGKMMVVRAIVEQLNLIAIAPSASPLKDLNETVGFAAFTPLQMMNELKQLNNSKLNFLRKVIIGGGAVGDELEVMLKHQPFEAYETYGMTETLTHVALRHINGPNPQKYFHPLTDVKLRCDKRGCLMVEVPGVTDGLIVTNDFADIQPDGSFCITGRIDNVINSGGLKIQPEKIEALIATLQLGEIYASAIEHNTLGEQLVLVTSQLNKSPVDLSHELEQILPRNVMPAALFLVDAFPKTESGKIQRKNLKKLIATLKPVYSR
jgi:O-succinylbenzoic acid--CoA ligase